VHIRTTDNDKDSRYNKLSCSTVLHNILPLPVAAKPVNCTVDGCVQVVASQYLYIKTGYSVNNTNITV